MVSNAAAGPSRPVGVPIIPPLAMLDKENTRDNLRKHEPKLGKGGLTLKSRHTSTSKRRALSSRGESPQLLRPRMSGSDSVTPLRSERNHANKESATSRKDTRRRVLRYGETVESLFCLTERSVMEHRRLCQNIVDGLVANEAVAWHRALEFATQSINTSNLSQAAGLDLIRLHRRATSRFSLVSYEDQSEILAMWLSYAGAQAKYGSREEARLTFRHIQSQRVDPDASFFLALAEFQSIEDIEAAKKTLRSALEKKVEPMGKLKALLHVLDREGNNEAGAKEIANKMSDTKRSSLDTDSGLHSLIPPLPSRSSLNQYKKRRSSAGTTISKGKSPSREDTDHDIQPRQKADSDDSSLAQKKEDTASNMSLDKSSMSMDADLSLSMSLSISDPAEIDGVEAEETVQHSQKPSKSSAQARKDDKTQSAIVDPISIQLGCKSQIIGQTVPKRHKRDSLRSLADSSLAEQIADTAKGILVVSRATAPKFNLPASKQSLLASRTSRIPRVGLSGRAQRVNPEQSFIEDSDDSDVEKVTTSAKNQLNQGACLDDLAPLKPVRKVTKMDLSYMLNWDPASARSKSSATSTNKANSTTMEKIDEASASGSMHSKNGAKTPSTLTSSTHDSITKTAHSNGSQHSERTGENRQTKENNAGLLHAAFTPTPETYISPETAALVARSNPDFLPLVSEDNILKVNNVPYAKLGVIGKGGSCKVYRALSKECSVLAIKKVKLGGMDKKAIDGYANEIALLKRLRGNPAIIQMHDSEVDYSRKAIFLVMEVGEVDLNQVLHQQTLLSAKKTGSEGKRPRLNMNFIRLTWQQMLSAVHCIHEERIIHGDLKPANFLFVRGALKLIDFGIAKAIQSDDTTNIYRESQIGTLNYMSPESILDTGSSIHGASMKCGRSSDIWSLGCILYQMVYGRTPFADLHMIQKLQAIVNPNHAIRFPDDVDEAAIDAMKRCLRRNADERLPIVGDNGLLNEHWFLHSHRRAHK